MNISDNHNIITNDEYEIYVGIRVGTSVLSPSISLTLLILSAFTTAQKSPENMFVKNVSLYFKSLIVAKLTNRVPVNSCLINIFNCVEPEIRLHWFTTIWITLDLIRYCVHVSLQIYAHLHIDLFTIAYPSDIAVNQGIGMNTNTAFISSSSDKNGSIHRRKEINRKH
uniref:Uncharacterized protein n=1 Tax=Glossina palpalis gambiensis TaxID=67801 RepID=A0A1B0C690_9MUSC